MASPLDPSVEARRPGQLVRHIAANPLETISAALAPERRPVFAEYRRQWMAMDTAAEPTPFPLNLYIEPVSNCNLSCSFCVRNRPTWRARGGPIFSNSRLGMDAFRRIIDEGAGHGLPAIWLGASGEALLERDICGMLAYAHSRGVLDTILITNGLLLSPEIIDSLLDIPITRLTVSIDAFSPETYRLLRGGDYRRLLGNVDDFLRRRNERGQRLPILRVTFVEMAENAPEKDDFVAHWQTRADIVDVQKYWDFDVDGPPAERERDLSCAHPMRSLLVMATGDVYPCCSFYAMREHRLGNIAESSIADIWHSERLRRFRQDLASGRYSDACKLCHDASQ